MLVLDSISRHFISWHFIHSFIHSFIHLFIRWHFIHWHFIHWHFIRRFIHQNKNVCLNIYIPSIIIYNGVVVVVIRVVVFVFSNIVVGICGNCWGPLCIPVVVSTYLGRPI